MTVCFDPSRVKNRSKTSFLEHKTVCSSLKVWRCHAAKAHRRQHVNSANRDHTHSAVIGLWLTASCRYGAPVDPGFTGRLDRVTELCDERLRWSLQRAAERAPIPLRVAHWRNALRRDRSSCGTRNRGSPMMYRAAFVHMQSVLFVDVVNNSGRLSEVIVVAYTSRCLRWPRGTGW